MVSLTTVVLRQILNFTTYRLMTQTREKKYNLITHIPENLLSCYQFKGEVVVMVYRTYTLQFENFYSIGRTSVRRKTTRTGRDPSP